MKKVTVAIVLLAALLMGGRCYVPPPDDCDANCASELATCEEGVVVNLEACLVAGDVDPRVCAEEALMATLLCAEEAAACFEDCAAAPE